jgi:hypothetical protein
VKQQRRVEEALQGKKVALLEKKAELLVLQRKKMYVAAVPLKKGGCVVGEGAGESVCWLW